MQSVTAIQLESTLYDFYGVAAQQHPQFDQKTEILRDFLSKVTSQENNNDQGCQGLKDGNTETESSVDELDEPLRVQQTTPVFGSSMLFTFLFDSNSAVCHAPVPEKVTTRHNFNSGSIERLVLYALLVNHRHIQQRDAQHKQLLSQAESPYLQSYLLVRALKLAMVRAAKTLRSEIGAKSYAKIRFLYEEMVRRVDSCEDGQQKYLRLILEEFDSCYISQVYVELLQNNNSFASPTRSSQGIALQADSNPRADFSFSYEHLGAVLQRLSIKLTVVDNWESREMGRTNPALSIVVRQLRDGSFKLREIVTMSDVEQ